MVLQQLAQLRQSVSFQTSSSITAAIWSSPLGGLLPSLVKKDFILLLFRETFFLKERRLIGCITMDE